ncbi:MAG TPA: CD225/dispanin family protein [Flavobacteriaceae bacterium]|nr:CD225/dispanin family protein [Flavobacteriaceae bacterium]MCB9213235.1 CD225/dispanin family protein [Alteromonas sp.]HPF10093.1 CD225/dispanin family protein [Flavobacteriaceae bacterium]HQU22582.1 CD225/dispanin family protein [Flavobacteriaceae bacterium]HQU66407.1 CD225/dispanin family protein [Flavobacteriaceae bacterium]
MENQPKPKNYLVESILVTIFCCLVFGIIGIVNASKVNSEYAAGNYEGALKASQDAKKWTMWGFIVGAAILLIYVILYFVMGVAILGMGAGMGS